MPKYGIANAPGIRNFMWTLYSRICSVHFHIWESRKYLEPSRTSTMGLFCENSQRLSEKWKVLNLLNRKISYSGIIYAMWAWVARNKRQVEFFSSSPFSSLWLKGNYYKKKDVKRSRVQSPQPFEFIFLTLGKFDNITNCIQFILHWGLVFSW